MGMIQTAHPNKAHTTANKTAATTKRTARLLNNNECMPRIFRCKGEMILYNITPSQALFLGQVLFVQASMIGMHAATQRFDGFIGAAYRFVQYFLVLLGRHRILPSGAHQHRCTLQPNLPHFSPALRFFSKHQLVFGHCFLSPWLAEHPHAL